MTEPNSLEVKIARLEIALAKDVELLTTQIELISDEKNKALKIQTKELERRLDALNGEAERLREMQATYLPRETFENHIKNLNYGRIATITTVISFMVSIIVFLVSKIIK